MDENDQCEIDKEYLLLISGQFCVESIRLLNLSQMNASSLPDCMSKCQYLNNLNVSFNNLTPSSITCLKSLRHLQRLDCSYNRYMDSLSQFPDRELEYLNCEGCGFQDIRDLQRLEKFTKLRWVSFKDCPVSKSPGYEKLVKECLPALKFLDGEHVLLRMPMLDLKLETGNYELPKDEKWFENTEETEANFDSDLVRDFELHLKDSRKLLARADALLSS